MQPARRDVLKYAGMLTAAAVGVGGARQVLALTRQEGEGGEGGHNHKISPDAMGVLMDLTDCVGCRLCEYACKKANQFETGTLESYDDMSVFKEQRRPEPRAFTVVNAYHPMTGEGASKAVYTKVNCLHCNNPSCVSACIVGALQKDPLGAVSYDEWKCIGCRYCMVACPFQIPAYDYEDALTPQVRKCNFCQGRTSRGEQPACVKECPRQALVYGKRSDLLELARRRMAEHPGRYVEHVYGEHEVGGTAWIYLSPAPFEQVGFLKLKETAPPVLTESIQHGVFKFGAAPVGIYGFLASMYWLTGRRAQVAALAGGGTMIVDAPAETAAKVAVVKKEHPHQEHHPDAACVRRKLLTPGVWALMVVVLCGVVAGLYRLVMGLGAGTNLDQQHPWGLWIAMDVGSGIALAGGGFVTAALVHIFHRHHYHAIARSALLVALLGYTFYVPGLLADLGRWYNIWHPMLPNMWQGNSVLFEVGLCVMIYLNVQYAEMAPIICKRLTGKGLPKLIDRLLTITHDLLERIMPAFLVLGVTLSLFHQSSLGNLMVIAPYKLHALWWSPVAPILFLLSAMMVGFPMVIFTMIFGAWCLKRDANMKVLTPLARYPIIFLALYLSLKVGDMVVRGTGSYLAAPSLQSISWMVEMAGGVILPLVMLLLPSVRRSPVRLATACLLVILGVVLNRLNVFIIGYQPPYATKGYFPSLVEIALSLGLVAGLMLLYRVAVTYLPILEPEPTMEEKAK